MGATEIRREGIIGEFTIASRRKSNKRYCTAATNRPPGYQAINTSKHDELTIQFIYTKPDDADTQASGVNF